VRSDVLHGRLFPVFIDIDANLGSFGTFKNKSGSPEISASGGLDGTFRYAGAIRGIQREAEVLGDIKAAATFSSEDCPANVPSSLARRRLAWLSLFHCPDLIVFPAVLPPVDSITRMPDFNSPRASAPSIIANAMRSL
jgi:hypothetical protein